MRTKQMKLSRCQIEIDIDYKNVLPLPVEGEWSKIVPLRMMSFDIECVSKKGFPSAEKDPVIQISNYCKNHNEDDHMVKNIFVLKSCTGIVGADVRSFERE